MYCMDYRRTVAAVGLLPPITHYLVQKILTPLTVRLGPTTRYCSPAHAPRSMI